MPIPLPQALEERELHKSAYNIGGGEWQYLLDIHVDIIQRLLGSIHNWNVIEIGCYYGTLYERLASLGVEYYGVDPRYEFIDIGKRLYPTARIAHSTLIKLPYGDKVFGLAVLRSMEGTIKGEFGYEYWHSIEREALRVAEHALLLNYTRPDLFRLVESVPSPETQGTIELPHGRLGYRVGMDGSWELFDLHVEAGYRRQGIGRSLVNVLRGIARMGSIYGFTRVENEDAIAFYTALGFSMYTIKGLYRGQDAVMFTLTCL